ncbi:MAG: sulfotransferase family protein [Pseudomonadota bacterium]
MNKVISSQGADLPIVAILGAGRSGTNLLADVISAEDVFLNMVENRYVWNYRQATFDHDVRRADEATEPVARFIRLFFAAHAERSGQVPIDKTPSNIFRIPFLTAVFPRIKILHVIRDGRANIYSRLREWQGGNAVVAGQTADGKVETRKDYRSALLRRRLERISDMMHTGSLPASRIPAFLYDNVPTYLVQTLFGRAPRYGERFPGMSTHLKAHGLLETAGAQWREGVMQAVTAGCRLGPERYLQLRYEDLLDQPEPTWDRIAAFLGISSDGGGRAYLLDSIRPNAAPDWGNPAHADFLARLEPHIRPTCAFLGYKWN